MRYLAFGASMLIGLFILVEPATAAQPLRTSILDPAAFTGADADRSFRQTRETGASMVRLFLVWSAVAPRRPADAADPDEPSYRWEIFDEQVRGAIQHGLAPLVYISGSPAWARGRTVGLPGTWPSPRDFAAFTRAAARRYAGGFRPARDAAPLPRVYYWQAWNEPNAGREFAPQRRNGRPVSPEHYRRLVNAFADAVHGVDAGNLVVGGGLAPFGHDSKDIQVVPPMQFMSRLLCVARKPPHRRTCSQRTRFDAWSHHPYTNGGPSRRARSGDDASIGDLGEVRAMLAAARRAKTISARRAPEFWVTEISWDTSPPDPRAIPSGLHARWVSEALYRMWKAGVSTVTWFRLRDDPIRESPYQSGFFTAAGRPKLSSRAFRFPFVALRERSAVLVWGRTPPGLSRPVLVERRAGKRWVTVARLRPDRYGIFSRRLPASSAVTLRARLVGVDVSIPFALKAPPDRAVNPFGCGGPISCTRR